MEFTKERGQDASGFHSLYVSISIVVRLRCVWSIRLLLMAIRKRISYAASGDRSQCHFVKNRETAQYVLLEPTAVYGPNRSNQVVAAWPRKPASHLPVEASLDKTQFGMTSNLRNLTPTASVSSNVPTPKAPGFPQPRANAQQVSASWVISQADWQSA